MTMEITLPALSLAELGMLARIVDAGMWELASKPHSKEDEALWDQVCAKLQLPGYEGSIDDKVHKKHLAKVADASMPIVWIASVPNDWTRPLIQARMKPQLPLNAIALAMQPNLRTGTTDIAYAMPPGWSPPRPGDPSHHLSITWARTAPK